MLLLCTTSSHLHLRRSQWHVCGKEAPDLCAQTAPTGPPRSPPVARDRALPSPIDTVRASRHARNGKRARGKQEPAFPRVGRCRKMSPDGVGRSDVAPASPVLHLCFTSPQFIFAAAVTSPRPGRGHSQVMNRQTQMAHTVQTNTTRMANMHTSTN